MIKLQRSRAGVSIMSPCLWNIKMKFRLPSFFLSLSIRPSLSFSDSHFFPYFSICLFLSLSILSFLSFYLFLCILFLCVSVSLFYLSTNFFSYFILFSISFCDLSYNLYIFLHLFVPLSLSLTCMICANGGSCILAGVHTLIPSLNITPAEPIL